MHFRSYNYRHAESILNANYRLKKEIEQVLSELELEPPRRVPRNGAVPVHRQIQQAFQQRGWEAEVLASRRMRKRHFFDLYKDRVAIEIELSNRELLYRDYLRFLLAEAEGRIDVGMILLADYPDAAFPAGGLRTLPRLEQVVDDLNCLRGVVGVPLWVVALE